MKLLIVSRIKISNYLLLFDIKINIVLIILNKLILLFDLFLDDTK
jgi:hypothetical protein